MSIASFIPKVWSARLLEHLDKAHVVANLVNRDYEGEISAYGDTVSINQIGAITVKDYTTNTDIDAPEDLSTTETVLNIDKQKYFNFQIDDVDKAQARTSLMDVAMQRAAYALADATEMEILKAMDSEGTKLTPSKNLDETNVYKEIINVKVAMDKENVPTTGRYLIVSPETHAFLLQDDRFVGTGGTMAEDNLRNGFVGRVLGFDVYLSNNIASLTNGNGAIASVSMSTTFAEQIVETEAYRMEKRFSDSVKGLNVFGVKVTQPKAVICLKKTQA